MQHYPSEVQECIDQLKEYSVSSDLGRFNLIQMYPKELAYPHGYYDSRFFDLKGFNTELMQFRDLGIHDGMSFNPGVEIDICRIWADGSTLIRFVGFVEICHMTQLAYVSRIYN